MKRCFWCGEVGCPLRTQTNQIAVVAIVGVVLLFVLAGLGGPFR